MATFLTCLGICCLSMPDQEKYEYISSGPEKVRGAPLFLSPIMSPIEIVYIVHPTFENHYMRPYQGKPLSYPKTARLMVNSYLYINACKIIPFPQTHYSTITRRYLATLIMLPQFENFRRESKTNNPAYAQIPSDRR